MQILLVVNSSNQDQGLGVAFEAAIKEKKWQPVSTIPFTYSKSSGRLSETTDILKMVKADVNYAVLEAEWEKVDYLVQISDSKSRVFKTK
jgi:hypothetical protein